MSKSDQPAGVAVDRGVRPAVAYCPFCGSDAVKHVKSVPRCTACRAVFFADFGRYTRRGGGQPRCTEGRACEAPALCSKHGECFRK